MLAFGLTANTAQAQDTVSGAVVAVEAGDRIRVQLQGWTVTVHLHGIVCPEEPAALAERAREYTRRRLGKNTVSVSVRGTGTKQRLFGDVFPVGAKASLNEELLRVGLARWSRQYAAQRAEFARLETAAQNARRGLWSDPTGQNVPLPPLATPPPTPRPQPRATVAPTAQPKLSTPPSEPPVSYASPAERPNPEAEVKQSPPAPSQESQASQPARPPRPEMFYLAGFAFLAALLFALFQRQTGGGASAITFQLPVSLLLSGAAIGILFLPVQMALGALSLSPAAILATGAGLIALGCFALSTQIGAKERVLRGASRQPIRDLTPGFVRIAGETSAAGELVESLVGSIPALYLHEKTWRYEPLTDRPAKGRGNRPHGWVLIHEVQQSADFTVTDATGFIKVKAAGGTFHPLRAARFYNEIPVDTFFDDPYPGDTRTEILFLPATANVIVWGRFGGVSTVADPGLHLAYDPVQETLLVVEENPARVFTNRPLISLLCGVFGVLLLVLMGYLLLNPTPGFAGGSGIAPLATAGFTLGVALLTAFALLYRRVQRVWQNVPVAQEELISGYTRRDSLVDLLSGLPIPEAARPVQEEIRAILRTLPDPAQELVLWLQEQEHLSGRIGELLELLESAGNLSPEGRDLCLELRAREQELAEARQRFTRALQRWNYYRQAFPHTLVAQALFPMAAAEYPPAV
ncbi:MAG: hypothetical protein OHK0029_14370 [Armatimonadaceae bacterium]